ncbi:MAG: hypothetical protein M3N21_00450 [Actinomycetota bacterium]|nr:hypothetical protein [Actinomycetota bacterium]
MRAQRPGNRLINAASTARSAQSIHGAGRVRRRTATSWRNTSNSTSFDADERPNKTSQPHTTEDQIEQTETHS